MRVIVTGAAGFLRFALLRDALLAAEHRVIGVDNLVTGSMDYLEHLPKEARFSSTSMTSVSPSTWGRRITSSILPPPPALRTTSTRASRRWLSAQKAFPTAWN